MHVDQTDFLATWGREFADAVGEVAEACAQDAYEAYIAAFGVAPTFSLLQQFIPDQVSQLRDAAREVLETRAIEDRHVEEAVGRTVAHYR